MEEIIKASQTHLTRTDEAKLLHYEILKNGEDAAKAMVSFAMNLKTMRDKKLYSELGFDSFESYTVEAVGLKKSQAYDYISALERLGEKELEETAALGIGITKIKLLSAFNPIDRAEFIESNDVGEMSTRQLKEKIDELTRQGEQLSFELESAKEKETAGIDEIERLESEKAELERKLKELESRPHEVAVREPTDEEKAEIARVAVERETASLNDKLEKLKRDKRVEADRHKAETDKLKSENKKAAEKAVEEYRKANAELTRELESIKQRSQELEKQLRVSASPEITRFSFYFEAVQENMRKLLEALNTISDGDTKEKLRANLSRYAQKLANMTS